MPRILVIALAALLALVAGRDAALAFWRSNPAFEVPGFLADDPVLRLHATEKLYAEPAMFQQQTQAISQIARAVLRESPLNSVAMRQLAMVESLRSAGAGQRQIALAERISRRDLPSELMLIDATAQQDDVAATLSHYDHALSAYPEIRQQLFPILASELTEPDVRLALAAFAQKPWLRDFVTNAADFDVAPISLMAFYSELVGKVPNADLQAGTIRIINWLANNRQSAALGALARRLPGVAPGAFDQLGFNAMTTDARFKPLSWDIHNDGAIATEANGNSLVIQIEPENVAVAATRLTFLKPGVFEVSQTVSYAANAPQARLEWLVSCVGEVQSVIISETLPVASASTRHTMRLVVPAGCGAQAWQLKAAAGQSQFASTVRINGLAVKQT